MNTKNARYFLYFPSYSNSYAVYILTDIKKSARKVVYNKIRKNSDFLDGLTQFFKKFTVRFTFFT